MRDNNNIFLDINRDRIRKVLSETYRACSELLNVEFEISEDEFVKKIDPYVDSNRVSLPVSINLPSRLYPDMLIEVDLRRAKVFARIPSRARNHPKQVLINRYLKAL